VLPAFCVLSSAATPSSPAATTHRVEEGQLAPYTVTSSGPSEGMVWAVHLDPPSVVALARSPPSLVPGDTTRQRRAPLQASATLVGVMFGIGCIVQVDPSSAVTASSMPV
jgi:hypothetical protein